MPGLYTLLDPIRAGSRFESTASLVTEAAYAWLVTCGVDVARPDFKYC